LRSLGLSVGQPKQFETAPVEEQVSLGRLLDVLAMPMTPDDEDGCQVFLEKVYKQEYNRESMQVLFGLLREEKWSGLRLALTAKWIAKNKPWKDIKPADFITAPLGELHNFAWVQAECMKDRSAQSRMEAFRIADGLVMWRYIDGTELPFFTRVHPRD
jgi:hypothetical protein